MATSALPLKTPAKGSETERDKTPTPSIKSVSSKPAIGPTDISSPHELTAFVETLLEQLDTKFDEMSTQILDRMTQMSTRVDALEASIQDIINGDVSSSVPQSPSPVPGVRRSGSEA
ncbi:heat shock factor binding protein 1-domain-containing protein [Roridomyces roridus]|uniref:Heat shock factor binding protein 1-domain-containing protein n=1 Tax=Roridomyces roridus TaxID=1738132 RepID=A0AAD7CKM4_9AGAR|nr:heat shock factor binding protein 1-domain-containing protein [Roridomyces roridus]